MPHASKSGPRAASAVFQTSLGIQRVAEPGLVVEDRNIAIERRDATREADLPALAGELVRLGVDVIVTAGSASIRPAMRATTSIPIVMVADNADPVVAGYVSSYARPGGNVTGLTGLSLDVTAKRMELLKESVPGMSRVAVLRNPASPDRETLWSETTTAARALGLQVHAMDVANPSQLESLFAAAARERADGIIVRGRLVEASRSDVTTSHDEEQ
jgi:putative ABC transport system substrate-binding protein